MKVETAKEKVIREAYGENWYYVQNQHYGDGWLTEFGMTCISDFKGKELEFGVDRGNFKTFRLKSLSGIENNNGWIRIESEADLPSNYTECHFELKDGDIQIGSYVDHKNIFIGADEQYFSSEVVAYRIIEEPKKRIY